jgi:hypothetical protein
MLMSKICTGSYRGARGTKEKDTKEEVWKEQEIMGWCKGIMKLRGSTLAGAGGNRFEANRTQYHQGNWNPKGGQEN